MDAARSAGGNDGIHEHGNQASVHAAAQFPCQRLVSYTCNFSGSLLQWVHSEEEKEYVHRSETGTVGAGRRTEGVSELSPYIA